MNQELERDYFARVNTRVTAVFKMRLKWACMQRERLTARRVPEGEILCELGQHLEPHPEEANAARKQPKGEAKKKARVA